MPSLEELLSWSVSELRERFLDRERAVPDGLLEALDTDARHGARELARRIRDRRHGNRAEGQRLRTMLRFETELHEQGLTLIAGVDEAGMAPLAGPVVAGAVILKKGYKLRGLDDSKKILDERKREELARAIKEEAVAWSSGRAEVEEIDTINIYHAGLLAMRRAVEGLGTRPQYLLVDARKVPECAIPQKPIIKGDALSLSIAAASIIAKTTRDRLMFQMDAVYPGYGFADHKGYPTPHHCQTLQKLGATPIHRRSFQRVRIALGLEPLQGDLFAPPDEGAEEDGLEA
ncbi:MAG TPA: ribonuclease HII [Myxococcales bacterium]|jgi:ribonuclease HII|nr:ribonuclease HII [Myxococcales bacterium]